MSINITCEICGRQLVLLKNKNAKIDIKHERFEGYKTKDGSTYFAVPISEIHKLFDVPCPVCQTLEFHTFQKNQDETYSLYTGEDIFIENDQNLLLKSNKRLRPGAIYLRAREKFSQQTIFVEVMDKDNVIDLINESPYFVEKPDGFMIDIDSKNDYTYDLPEILDQMNHTIFIEAKGL